MTKKVQNIFNCKSTACCAVGKHFMVTPIRRLMKKHIAEYLRNFNANISFFYDYEFGFDSKVHRFFDKYG